MTLPVRPVTDRLPGAELPPGGVKLPFPPPRR